MSFAIFCLKGLIGYHRQASKQVVRLMKDLLQKPVRNVQTDEQPLVWRAVFDHQPAGEDGGADWYLASIERIANLAITILGPLFPPDQRRAARHVATIIWSGVHGICALAQGGNLRHVTHADPKRLAEDLVRSYLGGRDRRNPTATFS